MKTSARSIGLSVAGLIVAIGLAAAASIQGASRQSPAASDLVAHEWGTFTSIAGPDGQAVPWRPLSGPSDLPCFVTRQNPQSVKSIAAEPGGIRGVRATVRMETPVIYFYSPREAAVSVDVRFPRGVISEWYPHATVPAAVLTPGLAGMTGRIAWPSVRVLPNAQPQLVREPSPSHYYAARETDAAPVDVGGQPEKFLFYRGIASFPVPIRATIAEADRVHVTNDGRHDVPNVILFQNIGGRMGFRFGGVMTDALVFEAPPISSDVTALHAELQRMLEAEGLFPREAAAMIETWRDSWFEEGTRLIYIVPRASVDEILPLRIDPKPAQVVRAFVGRLELVTGDVRDRVEHALLTKNLQALESFGRFLEPIVESLAARPSLASRQADVADALRLVAASFATEPVCK